ncbi:MAG: hypothetical protein ACP5KN_16335 [Armatimonadota bacterium]
MMSNTGLRKPLRAAASLAALCALTAVAQPEGDVRVTESLPDPLTVDGANPLIYINDQSTDNFSGELALAMAGRGRIDLREFLVGYPREPWMNEDDYEQHRSEYITHHMEVRAKAEKAGFENLPPAQLGVFEHLMKPASGRVEDTEPIGSPGTDLIVEEARKASRERPLVIVAGGDLCTIADAYVTEPAIASSVVVYWHEQVNDINEQAGYNVQNSGWAAYIVLSRLATVLDSDQGSPKITEQRVREEIPEPLCTYMLTKEHWKYGNPLRKGVKHEGDPKALLLAAFPDTRGEPRFLRVVGLQAARWFGGAEVLPVLSYSTSPSHVVEITEIHDATEAWWEAWQ